MSSHDDEPDRSTGSVTGDEDDHRDEETEDQSVQEQQEMTDEPKVSLEDGELEDGELDDDDDNDGSGGGGGGGGGNNGATLDNTGNSEPISENASEAQSHLTGVASVVEKSGKSSTTDLSQPKKKEIPSLFDLKTTKPKSLKRIADIQGNKSYLQYVDHDRMDEDYYNNEGDEMAGSAWPRYPMPDDDYESSECDQEEPEDEFSAQIQQMLNRSAAASHGLGDKSPRGPYDSPSEDEDDEDAERPPPAKIPRVDYDDGDGDDDDGYGDVTKGNRKMMKKLLGTTNGRMNDNGDDSYQKKSKMILSRSNKHGEPGGGALEMQLPEKRRLMDTPMEERPQCKFFLEAKCKKGTNCPFNHDLPRPKKQDVCRFFLSGRHCGMGNDCPFSHDARGISGEENDCKPENMMLKKKKALLGSPPLQSRMMQPKDKRKIPSLFDIQINAEGPNAKEILQSAARRSVMQTSNPKPGLLGVAPPMVAAVGMLGSMNRMRFPPMGQGFFDGFNRPHLPPKLESQSHLHSNMEEHGMDNMAYGPPNPNPDFMPPSEAKENGLLQKVNYLNQNVDFLGRMDGQAVEEMPKNVSSDFVALPPNFPGFTAAVSAAMALPPPHFTTPNSIPVPSQPNLSIPGNLNDQPTMMQSMIPPPDLPPFAPQFTGGAPQAQLQSQSTASEVADLQRSAASPLSNAGDVDKPQVVGGVDVNHLPPKQRELYLRIFAQQKETPLLPLDQISSDRPREKTEENLAMQPAAGAITASSDLLKFLVPPQVSSQSSLPNSHVSTQPSSNSSFNITQMLSAICADGISTGTGLMSAEIQRLSDVVLEVSGTSLRGPYRLEPVTLDTAAITLPSFIDPKDSKYSSDPRVQKHKDDVVVAAVVHKDDNSRQPVVVAQTDVPLRTQRRDPRLARKENAAGKEEVAHPNQDTQPRLSAQQNAPGTAMALGGTSLGAAGLSGALPLGNMPPPGIPMGGMNHGGLPPGSLPMDIGPQQNGMNLGGLQHSGMMVGNMQLGGIPGGMNIGSSQSAGITGAGGMNANVPMAGMQHGGIGGMFGNRAPSGIQSLMSMGMQMAGMQGNPPIGTMQQCGPNLGNIGQGGMPFGGMHQGGLQPGSLPQGGAPSQQSILPLAAGIAMSAMQQQMGIAMQQRGLLPPPFLPQNQMSPMNAFQHVSNLIRAQMPFNTCPPTMFSADMAQHESSGASGLSIGSVGPNVSFPNTMQSNPSIPRPLLPLQLPPANVQMLAQSCSEPSVRLSSSPSLQTSQSDTGIPVNEPVGTIQPLPEISGSVELPVTSEINLDEAFASSENSAANTDRTIGHKDDYRFRIKKARNADDAEENALDDSPAPASPLASESDVESRHAALRNRDKLEFRSPLAEMGDSAGSSQGSGYNQPPNKKYQRMAEEENGARRSPAPSRPATKAGFKARQRAAGRRPQDKTAAVVPVFETSHDVTTEDVVPSVQSVKDMFKSIDPTASPFC